MINNVRLRKKKAIFINFCDYNKCKIKKKKALFIHSPGITSVEIESNRILDVFGIHEVTFFNDANHISFKHEALSRKIFADGAISIAKSMAGIAPGMYTTQDFFK